MTSLSTPPTQRWLALALGFLGWMFAGMEISSFTLVTRSAVLSMLPQDGPTVQTIDAATQANHKPHDQHEQYVKRWMAWYQATFLMGAAVGGWAFGWLGDRTGRAQALGWSVLTYSIAMGIGYFAATPEQLLIVRFISCLGVGGAWPNAVALAAESWPDVSRPWLAGLLGMAANCGFVLLGLIGCYKFIQVDDWRWVMLVCAAPAVIGALALWLAPEPPRWTASSGSPTRENSIREIFRPPYRRGTLLGIVLGAVPVLGTAVNAVWIMPWSEHAVQPRSLPPASTESVSMFASWLPAYDDPRAKAAWTQVSRSSGAMIGSLLGGWLASQCGRRVTYFGISLASLAVSGCLYGWLDPTHDSFAWFAFALGLVGVTYFGWLPLYLPELFPTRIRATGAGVTFNSGRAVAAVGAVLIAAILEASAVSGARIDYASIGLWTSGVYAIGLVAILFAPDTSKKRLEA